MKKIFLLMAAGIVFTPICSQAQCMIFGDYKTGAFGIGFNNDNARTSYQDCEDYAMKICRQNGSSDPTFLYKGNKKGWCAFVSGNSSDGKTMFKWGDGFSSKGEAESSVKEAYASAGGTKPDLVKIYTFYCYSNLKK